MREARGPSPLISSHKGRGHRTVVVFRALHQVQSTGLLTSHQPNSEGRQLSDWALRTQRLCANRQEASKAALSKLMPKTVID
jgi:aminoglycoside phosphotransferase (APT) family kinase protein